MVSKNNVVLCIVSFMLMITSGCQGNWPPPPVTVVPAVEADTPTEAASIKLQPPPEGQIYHAAYPDFGGWEDEVTSEKVTDFENLVGKEIGWAYFSNNWWQSQDGIHFPAARVADIYNKAGRIPFIRMMPRTEDPESGDMSLPDPNYSMQAFIDGVWDEDLSRWCQDAKATEIPLLVEFGTELNGWWFPWNATWNGEANKTDYGDPELYDGAERFRDAYRHIIDLCRAEGVNNITWFFHPDAENDPVEPWNEMAAYYPGDDYIDWIGISVYGPQEPVYDWVLFSDKLAQHWPEIKAISAEGKPIAILEWGVTGTHPEGDKAAWIDDAFETLTAADSPYSQIKGISWWHENFDQTTLRLDSSPEALDAYKKGAAADIFVTNLTFSGLGE